MTKETETKSQPDAQEFKLEAQTELRFEVEANCKVTVELKSGTAEIFGSQLVQNKKFSFNSGDKIAVFTWQGCALELVGKLEVAYVAKETPMMSYFNLHYVFEQMRSKAEKNVAKGPVVLITGPSDVGKTTLCRILLNYAVISNRRPVFVDLDVEINSISLPGTVSAAPVERVVEVDGGFSYPQPLVLHYGHKSPGTNIMLYNKVVSKLASVLSRFEEADKKAGISGSIINTGGWVKGEGYQAIKHAAKAFNANVVLVIDQERLYNELLLDISDKNTKIVFVPKSGGVVERSRQSRTEFADESVRQYFYGLKTRLYPHSFDVKFSEMRVYKIGAPSLPDSLMPLGMKPVDKRTKLVLVENGQNLLHRVLSMMSCAEGLEEDVVAANIVGFVCVTDVDLERRVATILSPHPRFQLKTVFLVGDVQFMDSH